jgi:hypothetical protein
MRNSTNGQIKDGSLLIARGKTYCFQIHRLSGRVELKFYSNRQNALIWAKTKRSFQTVSR